MAVGDHFHAEFTLFFQRLVREIPYSAEQGILIG